MFFTQLFLQGIELSSKGMNFKNDSKMINKPIFTQIPGVLK